MPLFRITLERTRTITERAEVDVDAATWEEATMTALAADPRDLMWSRDDTCASVSDIEVVS